MYKPFYVCGFDVMSAGHYKSKFGVIVGLPISFKYDSLETASDKPLIQVRKSKIVFSFIQYVEKFIVK